MTAIEPIYAESLRCHGIRAGFSTRRGGVSEPPFDSLNLGGTTRDNPDRVHENRNLFYRFLGIAPDRVALMKQVHGDHIALVDRGGLTPETDGLLSAEPGLMMGVLVADCAPLILYDPVRRCGGVLHCGWRPTVAGIAEQAVHLMHDAWGSRPGDILAVLGPSAGSCCYAIGPEVASQFSPVSIRERQGGIYADLRGEVVRRLLAAGLSPEAVEISTECTICGPDSFFSHRRDGGVTGRMMGFIILPNPSER